MGYPAFGKVKTIVLPVPGEQMKFTEYKEKYGIDLKEFFEVKENDINLKNVKNAVIYFDLSDVSDNAPVEFIGKLLPLGATIYASQSYESKVTSGAIYYKIPYYNSDNIIDFIGYISIELSKDEELSIDNARIGYFEN